MNGMEVIWSLQQKTGIRPDECSELRSRHAYAVKLVDFSRARTTAGQQ